MRFGKAPREVAGALWRSLSEPEKDVYFSLVTLAMDRTREADVSRVDLAKETGRAKETVSRAVAGLEVKGLVEVKKTGRENRYRVPLTGFAERAAAGGGTRGKNKRRAPPLSDTKQVTAASPISTRQVTSGDGIGDRLDKTGDPPVTPLLIERKRERDLRDPDPLSQLSGEEDGAKAQDGPLAEVVAEELEQAQVRAQEEPAPEEPRGLLDGAPPGPEEQAAAEAKLDPATARARARALEAYAARQDPARAPPSSGEN